MLLSLFHWKRDHPDLFKQIRDTADQDMVRWGDEQIRGRFLLCGPVSNESGHRREWVAIFNPIRVRACHI